MENIPTWIAVVAGAMQDASGRYLLQRRPLQKQHGGLWEFPGGKVELGENPRDALVRELGEELTVNVGRDALAPIAFAEEGPADGRTGIVILLYKVSEWDGEPVAEEGAALGWFQLAEAARLATPPLDRTLLESLCSTVQ